MRIGRGDNGQMFRSVVGMQTYSTLMTCLLTWKAQDKDVLEKFTRLSCQTKALVPGMTCFRCYDSGVGQLLKTYIKTPRYDRTRAGRLLTY